MPDSASTHQDQYDFENRLIRRYDGTKEIRFIYDGDGNRVMKMVTIGGDTYTTNYVVDDQNLTGYAQVLMEYDNLGYEAARYSYGASLVSQTRWEQRTVNLIGTFYYGLDGHGSVRFLTKDDGTVSDTYNYDGFGILLDRLPTSAGSQTPNTRLYCGEEWDPHLGMYYLRARYYAPDVGRFWSADDGNHGNEDDPQSLHLYVFCEGNPVSSWDPSGRCQVAGKTSQGVAGENQPLLR